jgi:hypothetical protein
MGMARVGRLIAKQDAKKAHGSFFGILLASNNRAKSQCILGEERTP